VSSGLLILLPSVVDKQIACPFRTLMQSQDRALLQPVFAMLNMSLVAVEIGCARIDTARRRAKWCGIASVVAILAAQYVRYLAIRAGEYLPTAE
jgi:hypothetical protein